MALIKEEKYGNWQNVAELIDFNILKFAPQGLLGTGKADVMLLYKKKPGEKIKDQKRLIIFGHEKEVYERVIDKIGEKKNHAKKIEFLHKFNKAWATTDYEPSQSEPKTLLKHKIFDLGLNTKEFAEHSGLQAPALYHHVSGGREISRETAIEYAKKLGCDPVDLMFPKKTIPIWSKVNLLNYEGTKEFTALYKPGRLYTYTIAKETDVVDYAYDENTKPLEKVVVPRDIYREDIKAIKIEARGSMYHNKIAFYYRATDKTGDYLNQLCVVGVDVTTDFGDRVFRDAPDIETHYYFGLYEEVKGQANLINPDPYAKPEVKNILTDFEPKFIAPIIAIVNPAAVVDQTKLKHNIPQAALVNKEEHFKMQLNQKHAEIGRLKKALEEKITQEQTREKLRNLKELEVRQKKAEKEMNDLFSKVLETRDRINKDMARKKIYGGISDLFYKDREALDAVQKSLSPQTNVLKGQNVLRNWTKQKSLAALKSGKKS